MHNYLNLFGSIIEKIFKFLTVYLYRVGLAGALYLNESNNFEIYMFFCCLYNDSFGWNSDG